MERKSLGVVEDHVEVVEEKCW